jgi:hypothetical protein
MKAYCRAQIYVAALNSCDKITKAGPNKPKDTISQQVNKKSEALTCAPSKAHAIRINNDPHRFIEDRSAMQLLLLQLHEELQSIQTSHRSVESLRESNNEHIFALCAMSCASSSRQLDGRNMVNELSSFLIFSFPAIPLILFDSPRRFWERNHPTIFEQQWPTLPIYRGMHDRAVSEFLDVCLEALALRPRDVSNLISKELCVIASGETFLELDCLSPYHKIHKRVVEATLASETLWQVHEIVLSMKPMPIQELQKHLPRTMANDITNDQSCLDLLRSPFKETRLAAIEA